MKVLQMRVPRYLMLHASNYSATQKVMLERIMRGAGFNPASGFDVHMHARFKDLVSFKGKAKKKQIINEDRRADYESTLKHYIKTLKPSVILINDPAALGFIAGSMSLHNCRGSVYMFGGVPCVVLNDILLTKRVKTETFLLVNDLKKAQRWRTGTQRHEPKFEYTVCHTREDLLAFREAAKDAAFISKDIETSKDFITCDGFTTLSHDGTLMSYVIPFYNPTKESNAHWEHEEDEILAWEIIGEANQNVAPKIMQNGTYDSAYYTKYRVPPVNYTLDTQHLWHSIWVEAKKSLIMITSVAMDHMQYWKDEIKGDKKDKDKNERVPTTLKGLEIYWRYNALDCYNTMLSAMWLMRMITSPNLKWALDNYILEMRQVLGPAFAMTMRGMKCVEDIKEHHRKSLYVEHIKNLNDLRTMADDQEYNPGSSQQNASLLYDVLGATPMQVRGKKSLGARSTDEKALKFVRLQHPLYARFIDAIWATKKPLNNMSKYGMMKTLNGRFMYQMGAGNTETDRYASREHQFWVGTNAQNVPAKLRDMFKADKGMALVDADFSQSDAYFVAFHCNDEKYIETMLDDRDTHCVHAEFFFKKAYQEVYDRYKAGDPWAVDPLTGVRQNTKRIVHGGNYRMAGFTLYITMGHDETVAVAKAMGHDDAHKWTQNQLVALCEQLLIGFLRMYPGLETWFTTSIEECVANNNMATNAFGRTRLFFGDMAKDEAIQRQVSAWYGQSGTAGNINRTLDEIYFDSDLERTDGVQLLAQVHDSIVFQVPLDNLQSVNKVLTIMEKPVTINGRTFSVPAQADIGIHWKTGMIGYTPDVTREQVLATQHKVWQRYPEIYSAQLAELTQATA